MDSPKFYPEKVYVVRDSLKFPMTERVLRALDGVPLLIVENEQEAFDEIRYLPDPLKIGKKQLLLTRQRGGFVKPCPCTPNHIGCNYYIINADLHCPMDCSYCILQTYLANPLITVHVNTRDMEKQLLEFLYRNPRPLRIGTGELGDSLALDHITERSVDMIRFFRNKKNALFELKTKTVNIDNILKTDPADNIIIAWSLNTKQAASEEEKGAPSVRDRIKAAARVSERGYRVAFHFDPLIRCSEWEKGYHEVIAELMAHIPREKIAWISLGALRFPPALKPIIKRRFPQSKIIYKELIRGKDGKFRYFKPFRRDLFKKIMGFMQSEEGADLPLYFCMEDSSTWRRILGKRPKGKKDVEENLSLPLVQYRK